MNTFFQLLKKDWRLNRAPLLALALVAVGPYVLGWAMFAWDVHQNSVHGHSNWNDRSITSIAEMLFRSGAMSLFCSGIVGAALGANAFATERREHWADFLAMMPATRRQIIYSKLIICVGALSFFWAVSLAIWTMATNRYPGGLMPGLPRLYAIWLAARPAVYVICLGIAAFGLSWLLSVFLNSAAIAACIAILILLAFGTTYATFEKLIVTQLSMEFTDALAFISLLTGIISLTAGSIIYNRRVAP